MQYKFMQPVLANSRIKRSHYGKWLVLYTPTPYTLWCTLSLIFVDTIGGGPYMEVVLKRKYNITAI
jgi:hypothetical protein